MPNFEACHWVISSSIKFSFLMSENLAQCECFLEESIKENAAKEKIKKGLATKEIQLHLK